MATSSSWTIFWYLYEQQRVPLDHSNPNFTPTVAHLLHFFSQFEIRFITSRVLQMLSPTDCPVSTQRFILLSLKIMIVARFVLPVMGTFGIKVFMWRPYVLFHASTRIYIKYAWISCGGYGTHCWNISPSKYISTIKSSTSTTLSKWTLPKLKNSICGRLHQG